MKSLQVDVHASSASVTLSHVFAGFAQANQCNSVFGCVEEQQFERCTCYRDCGYDGDPVCGSDGQLYQNLCQMEVFACRNGTRIKQVPLSQCPQSKTALSCRGPHSVIIKLSGSSFILELLHMVGVCVNVK